MNLYEIRFRDKNELESFRRAVKSHIKNPDISIRYEEGEKYATYISTFNSEIDRKLKEVFSLTPALSAWKGRLKQDNCQCGNGKNCCRISGISDGTCTCSDL